MKRGVSSALMVLVVTTVMAVPAKSGLSKMITLIDGSHVNVTLIGDEHIHFYVDSDGVKYGLNADGYYERLSAEQFSALQRRSSLRRSALAKSQRLLRAASQRRTSSTFTGKKKGIIILVQFSDMSFKSGHDQTLYNNIANTEGYSDNNGFIGSVHDYFMAQSGGVFDLEFDVVGPVTLSREYSYYGSNDSYGNDKRPEYMVKEACDSVDSIVNFSDYDWDGDGYVDQVFVLYAGHGENSSSDEDTVWPHEWQLSASALGKQTYDSVTVDTYACSSELSTYKIDGIGTICHEFSHCLGYPDLYDTTYSGYFGMGDLDLMCSGSYNGNAFCPAGYTSYEKWVAGWIDPVELNTADTTISDLQPISDGGGAYIIYNQGNKNEYYLVENRQYVNWDAKLPSRGLQVTHVDYNADMWYDNTLNSPGTYTYSEGYSGNYTVDHEHLTIFHADNDDDRSYWSSSNYYYSKTTTSTDLYPYSSNDSLTNNSTPAASLYNANSDGTLMMNHRLYDITQNDDSTMSFSFGAVSTTVTDNNDSGGDDNGNDSTAVSGDTLFHETFDQCSGRGGNDGSWNGNLGSADIVADNNGWVCVKGFAGYQCGRFGTSKVGGQATTPAIAVDGTDSLIVRIAPWDTKSESHTVDIRVVINGQEYTLDSPTLTTGTWTTLSYAITYNGSAKIYFVGGKRFFIDDLLVYKPKSTSAIRELSYPTDTSRRIYSVTGLYLGTDTHILPSGIYIVGGKKTVK